MNPVVKALGHVLFLAVSLVYRIAAAESLVPVIQNSFPPQMTVAAGVPVQFAIEATGPGTLYYRWVLRGTNFVSTNGLAEILFENNEGSQDVLTVFVYNRYGYTNRQCAVKALNKPKISVAPTEVVALTGGSFNIEVYATSATFQWLKDGAELTGQTNYYVRRDNVTLDHAGEYRVAAKNEIGTTVSDPISVRVLTTNSPPVVFDPPAELHMLSTETKSVDAKAVGFGVAVDVHRQDGSIVSTGPIGTVRIEPEPGEFYFVARNGFGSSTSHVCKVIVHPTEAVIILSGSSETQTNLIEGNEPLNLNVDLLQGENVRYQWYLNDYAIPGATSATFHVTDKFDPIQFAALYELRATNEISSDTRRSWVELNAPPYGWLMYGINGWAGEIGETVSLFAIPSYAQPPVQWYRNGQPLAGETNYTLQFTLSAETLGTYHITAHDARGDHPSNPAQVILRNMTIATRDFRLIADVPYQFAAPGSSGPQALMPVFGGIKNNVVTLIIDGSLYRWSGALEKIVDRQTSLPPFRDGHWKVSSCSVEENGVMNFIVESDDGFPQSALFERNADGLKIIAQSGDTIADRPDGAIQTIRNAIRANGKIAMEVFGMDGPAGWGGYHALHVWDGTKLTRWADSTDATIENFSLEGPIAFDGESIAIAAHTGRYYESAIYKITPVAVERILGRLDRIAGLTNRFLSPGGRVAVENGKVLFDGYVDGGYDWNALVEYSPAAEQKFRVVAKPGATTDRGLSLTRIQSLFAYAGDGSILFSSLACGFTPPEYDTNLFPFGITAYGVFRERNGVISEELTSWDRVAGREIGLQLAGADGANFVLTGPMSLGSGFSYYTTLPGLPRPQNTRVDLIDRGVGKFDAMWSDGGRLQRSRDLINWHDILAAPGVVTNNFAQGAEFLRVYHP